MIPKIQYDRDRNTHFELLHLCRGTLIRLHFGKDLLKIIKTIINAAVIKQIKQIYQIKTIKVTKVDYFSELARTNSLMNFRLFDLLDLFDLSNFQKKKKKKKKKELNCYFTRYFGQCLAMTLLMPKYYPDKNRNKKNIIHVCVFKMDEHMVDVLSITLYYDHCIKRRRLHALADPGEGCVPAHAPQTGSNSFVFTYVFAKKCPRQRSAPPTARRPPPPTGNPGSATGMTCVIILH